MTQVADLLTPAAARRYPLAAMLAWDTWTEHVQSAIDTVEITAAAGRYGAATSPTPRVDVTATGELDGPLARPVDIPDMWELGSAGWHVAAEGGVLRLGDGGEVVDGCRGFEGGV